MDNPSLRQSEVLYYKLKPNGDFFLQKLHQPFLPELKSSVMKFLATTDEAPRGVCAPLIPENNALLSPNP